LAQAINKLRHGMGQLNREGRERLKAAFESVNIILGGFLRSFWGWAGASRA
jgi:chromosome segregation ATPase